MLNIDTRLLNEVNENELWLLCHIAKRIGKNRTCWPSNKRLCDETGWSINKLQKVKTALIKKGLVKVIPRVTNDGGQHSNAYQVTSGHIGFYISLAEVDPLQDEDDTHDSNEGTPTPQSELFPIPQDSATEVLTTEVLTNEDITHDVIDCLNAVKQRYGIKGKVHHTNSRAVTIRARVKENKVTMDQIRTMIDFKAAEWKGKTFGDGRRCTDYLTIETMFAPKHFMKYIEQSEAAPTKDWTERRDEGNSTQGAPTSLPADFKW